MASCVAERKPFWTALRQCCLMLPKSSFSCLGFFLYYRAAFLPFDAVKMAELGWGKDFRVTAAIIAFNDLSPM